MRSNAVALLLISALGVVAACAAPVAPDDLGGSSGRKNSKDNDDDSDDDDSKKKSDSPSSSSTGTTPNSTPPSTCAASQLSCGGKCVDPQTDNANCGTCGRTCGAGVCSKGSCPGQLKVRGFVDGKAQLVFGATKVKWHSIDAAAPGLWQGHKEATFLNGVAWTPAWPSDGENRDCNCDSQPSPGVAQGLAAIDQVVTVQKIEGRGDVSVSEQPSAANGFTVKIDLNDPQDGASWYELTLDFRAK